MTLLEVVDVEPCLGFLSRLDCRLLEAIDTAEEAMGSVPLSLIFVFTKSRGYCQGDDGMKNQKEIVCLGICWKMKETNIDKCLKVGEGEAYFEREIFWRESEREYEPIVASGACAWIVVLGELKGSGWWSQLNNFQNRCFFHFP